MLYLSIKEMEAEVNRVLRGGSYHEVLSEGFGLSLTRKDLLTLNNLNWLNDEVSTQYPQGEIGDHDHGYILHVIIVAQLSHTVVPVPVTEIIPP